MSFRFPFARKTDGRFRGWTLEDIAKFQGVDYDFKRLEPGILWLKEIVEWAEGKGTHPEMVLAVREFLKVPWVAVALDQAQDEEKALRAARAIKRNRNNYHDRCRQTDYADRNAERGY